MAADGPGVPGSDPVSSAAALDGFSAATRAWFEGAFAVPTQAQAQAWRAIGGRDSGGIGADTLVIAPTGSGKTLAAFLWAIDRLAATPPPADRKRRTRVLYVSPLKALAVDIERNLRSPLTGIRQAARRLGLPEPDIQVAVRTGDTAAEERRKIATRPPDILITTPESLFLLLTSQARETLRGVETVIVDEVHAVAGTKRGAHLALSLERLDALRGTGGGRHGTGGGRAQRIGLSATVRPPAEVASFLGGSRPVTVVQPASTKQIELKVVVPVEDMRDLSDMPATGPRGMVDGDHDPEPRRSIWPHVEERVLDLIQAHRSTIVFANSRRLAERLCGRLNELAAERAYVAAGGTPEDAASADIQDVIIARAHHGSVSRQERTEIEEALKAGRLPAVVATSSLELGIDMGAVDLVIQVESPPSVASGLQRVGRAGHNVGDVSRGVIFPKYAARPGAGRRGGRPDAVRPDRGAARTAQPARRARPAGRGDDRARRLGGGRPGGRDPPVGAVRDADQVRARGGARHARRALPGRGVRRAQAADRMGPGGRRHPRQARRAEARGDQRRDNPRPRLLRRVPAGRPENAKAPRRVGELDEEMVYESRVGDVFVLGASSWRIQDITPDRVLVLPAPGQPGKLPFWHGDTPGRPAELGKAIGAKLRMLAAMGPDAATESLIASGLDPLAAGNLVSYLEDQRQATGHLPDDRTLVVERFRDELGDWRVVLHSPYGDRVHAPWALAITARLRERYGGMDVQALHTDDGIIIRVPDSDEPPPAGIALLDPEEIGDIITAEVGGSALFASRFRECAARALLLPRRQPGRRTPLWQQRQRSAQLLEIAAQFPGFPITLETVRECLQDVFDVPALTEVLRDLAARRIRLVEVETATPSPFGRNLMFRYIGAFMYEGDAPLAERRAQALALDPSLLAELLGTEGLRELLDPAVVAETEADLQHLSAARQCKDAEAVADLLRTSGPLTAAEVAARCADPDGRSRLARRAGRGAARHRGAGGRAADVGGDRGRGTAAGRARRGAARRHPRGVHRAAARPARRPGGALGADARAVRRRRPRGALRARGGRGRDVAAPAGGRRAGRGGRVPRRDARHPVVRQRCAAHAAATLPGPAAQGGGAGAARRARPVPARLARHRHRQVPAGGRRARCSRRSSGWPARRSPRPRWRRWYCPGGCPATPPRCSTSSPRQAR